jgi:hypothetical protein
MINSQGSTASDQTGPHPPSSFRMSAVLAVLCLAPSRAAVSDDELLGALGHGVEGVHRHRA